MSAADRLAHPGDWPRAASELAAEGDPAVLPDLVAAYDQPVEASRGDLLDAMEALGGGGRRGGWRGRRMRTSAGWRRG